MLINIEKAHEQTASGATADAIVLLAGSVHEFYLTGSRFFGCAKVWSDWDFLAREAALSKRASNAWAQRRPTHGTRTPLVCT